MSDLLSLVANSPVWAIRPGYAKLWLMNLASGLGGKSVGKKAEAPKPKPLAVNTGAALSVFPYPVFDVVDGVAYIPVHGPLFARETLEISDDLMCSTMTGYHTVFQHFARAEADPEVREIVFSFDTPGGDATYVESLFQDILAGSKPSTARVEGMCASAGIYLAAGCDQISISPGSSIGCYGVYTVLEDYTEYLASLGIKLEVRSSGGVKGLGADGQITDELREETDQLIQSLGATFAQSLATGRGLSAAQMERIVQGRIYSPDAAIPLGLADSIETTQQFLERMATASATASAETFTLTLGSPTAMDKTEVQPAAEAPETPDQQAAADSAPDVSTAGTAVLTDEQVQQILDDNKALRKELAKTSTVLQEAIAKGREEDLARRATAEFSAASGKKLTPYQAKEFGAVHLHLVQSGADDVAAALLKGIADLKGHGLLEPMVAAVGPELVQPPREEEEKGDAPVASARAAVQAHGFGKKVEVN